MAKSKKLVKIKDPECLNCGYPFSGYEVFCPECGQKNKGVKLTFGSFIKEVFNGFVSWDAKFWKTIVPLIIKPGKVSKDYVEGKRMRYSNPFRFYITVSIIFFILLGFFNNFNEFKYLNNGNTKKETSKKKTKKKSGDKKEITQQEIDSIKNEVIESLDKNPFMPAVAKKEILKAVEQKAKDTTAYSSGGNSISFGGSSRIDKFFKFQKKHPELEIDDALDSLKYDKVFLNRFLYKRASVTNSLLNNKDIENTLEKEMISYGSISLFILLPIFAIFLKLFYIRRKYTYVEHLIFVFHTQTVFFILSLIYLLLNFFFEIDTEWLFILLFLIYLFMAMKKFYQQGNFKTFIKFSMINFIYMILATFGVVFAFAASFAFM